MESLNDVSHDAAQAWFGDQAAAVARSAYPQGRHAVMVERSAPAGAMAPLHRRDELEHYRVVEGEVTFFVGPTWCERGPEMSSPLGLESSARSGWSPVGRAGPS